jgi:hypothetical protein
VSTFTESVVEQAALAWLEGLGWTIKHGPDVAPGELAAERSDYAQVVLTERLRQAGWLTEMLDRLSEVSQPRVKGTRPRFARHERGTPLSEDSRRCP